MTDNNSFKSLFSNLLKGDFSSLINFKNIHLENIDIFIKGNIYNCSTENLIKNYSKYGLNSFKNIDGEFLIIVLQNNSLHFIRDRHGAGNQLFYSSDFCTSNLKEFTTLDGFKCIPNHEALFTFLSIGYIPSPLTSLEGVKKLNPGHVLTYEESNLITMDLFDYKEYMSKVGTSKIKIEDATQEYEQLHKKSIQDRISSKNKVGLLLSGGYDSAGNISALRDVYHGDVVSFSIGFKDNPWTELPLAKILSEKYNSKHYEYEIDGHEIMDLPQIITSTGDPFQEGGLMVNFTAMRLVKESEELPQIILGGDGNDQHFGTAGKELAINWKFKKLGLQNFQNIYDKLGDNLDVFDKDNILFRTEFHNRKILHIQQSDVFGFNLHKLNKINSVNCNIKNYSYLQNNSKRFTSFDDFYFHRNFNIDIKQVIDEVILFKSSRMSELFQNNMSFPYMSTDLYKFLNEMPVEYKCQGGVDNIAKGKGISKFLHKNYLKPKLPTEITNRKKQGGFAPLPIFLKEANQRKIIFEIIRKSDMIKTLLNFNEIDKLLLQYENIVNSKSYWFWFQQVKANQIINLLTLTVWWEMFINKKNIHSIYELI